MKDKIEDNALNHTGNDGVCKLIDSLTQGIQRLESVNINSKHLTEKLEDVLNSLDFN